MKTHWNKTIGDHLDYVELHDGSVLVGANEGTIASDSAGMCSDSDFLAGRFHDLILSAFGEQVLAEIVAAVQLRSTANASSDVAGPTD